MSNSKTGRGSLKSGWNQVVRDFDAAVLNAGFTSVEHFLIGKARFATWTLSKIDGKDGEAYPFRLDFSALAPLIDANPKYLAATFRSLVARGIFKESAKHPGFHLFAKDYSTWMAAAPEGDKTPDPLLSERALADADQVRTDLVANINSWADVIRIPRQKFLSGEAEISAEGPESADAKAENSAQKGRNFCPERQKFLPSHIDEARTASGEKEREEREEKTPQPPASGGDGRDLPPNSMTPTRDDPAERARGEVAAIVAKASADDILAERCGAAAAGKVREGYAEGDVVTAWARVIDSRTSRKNWGSEVATNLANRKVRGELAVERIKAGGAATKPIPTPAPFVPPPLPAGAPPVKYQRFGGKPAGKKP